MRLSRRLRYSTLGSEINVLKSFAVLVFHFLWRLLHIEMLKFCSIDPCPRGLCGGAMFRSLQPENDPALEDIVYCTANSRLTSFNTGHSKDLPEHTPSGRNFRAIFFQHHRGDRKAAIVGNTS